MQVEEANKVEGPIKKMWGSKRVTAWRQNSNKEPDPQAGIRILAVTEDAAAWECLRDIVVSSGWDFLVARGGGHAVSILKKRPIPIVIFDRDAAGDSWREAFREIAASGDAPCIFLASTVADDYLWQEVVLNRGFDILVKPFRQDQVVRSVNFAWAWYLWKRNKQMQTLGSVPA